MKRTMLGLLILAVVACGGSETSGSTGPHDSFDGVWLVTSATGKPAQQFNFYRAADAALRISGWVFYEPTDPDHICYVGGEKLTVNGSTVAGTGVMSANTTAFTVPLSVTFDSATHFTGTLGSVTLEGSR